MISTKNPAARPLVDAATGLDRSSSLYKGYLQKKTRKGSWQRRFFFILTTGRGATFLAYSKTDKISDPILASMDLCQAGPVELLSDRRCFGIHWDKHRLFMAANPAEALGWVNSIKRIQAEATREWGAMKKQSPGGASCCCCTIV